MHRLLCLLLLLPAWASAQENRGGKRTCRIVFPMAPAGAPERLQLFDGTAFQEVELPRMSFSPVYELPAGEVMLRLLPARVEPVPAEAPRAAVAAAVADCYLVVSSDPANPVAPVRVQVIDAGADKLKTGEMLWMNLTSHEIKGVVGSGSLAMTPRSRKVIAAPLPAAGDYLVHLDYRIADDPRSYPLCETKWLHDPRARMVVFIFADRERSAPRVLGFPDVRVKNGTERE